MSNGLVKKCTFSMLTVKEEVKMLSVLCISTGVTTGMLVCESYVAPTGYVIWMLWNRMIQ
jgi:hypothetical protein